MIKTCDGCQEKIVRFTNAIMIVKFNNGETNYYCNEDCLLSDYA